MSSSAMIADISRSCLRSHDFDRRHRFWIFGSLIELPGLPRLLICLHCHYFEASSQTRTRPLTTERRTFFVCCLSRISRKHSQRICLVCQSFSSRTEYHNIETQFSIPSTSILISTSSSKDDFHPSGPQHHLLSHSSTPESKNQHASPKRALRRHKNPIWWWHILRPRRMSWR